MLPKGPYDPQSTEKEILAFWLENNFYSPDFKSKNNLSTANSVNRDSFAIVLPPPNANGNLHLGHMSGYAYQDLMGRYNRMLRKKVLLLPGKDHAGIQTEVVFERELEKQNLSKRDLGREEFYRQCYEFCIQNSENAREQEKKIGLSADFERELFTLDPKIVKEVLKAFELMYHDGLAYRDKRIINWCPRCQSALADIDTEFKDSVTPFYYFKYGFLEPDADAVKIKNDFIEKQNVEWIFERSKSPDGKETYPFSLGKIKDGYQMDYGEMFVHTLGYDNDNLTKGQVLTGNPYALMMRLNRNFSLILVNPEFTGDIEVELNKLWEIAEAKKRDAGIHFIRFAEYPDDKFYTNGFILGTVRPETKFGDTALAVDPDDERYKPYVGKQFEVMTLNGPAKMNVIADNAVDENFGTGMVKVTPAHSLDDWEIAKRHSNEALPEIQVIDFNGKMNHMAGKYQGMKVKEARLAMIDDLKKAGMLISLDENYKNRIRICERCKHPIEPLISYQWFVDTKPLKAEAKRLVEQGFTEIMPEGKKKTFFQWMNTDEDWCITRQLWWGYRLPVWYKGERSQYISETGEVKESIGGKIIEKTEDYEGLLYVGNNDPNIQTVFLVPGKHGYMYREIYPKLEQSYPNANSVSVDNLENPSYKDYVTAFANINMQGQAVVAHSLGAKSIIKYIVENDVKLKTLVLIAAAPKLREKDINAPYANLFDPIDYEKLESLVERIVFIYADNDDLVNLEDFDNVYKSKLPNSEFYLESGLGHYASADYNHVSPKLLEILNELTTTEKITVSVLRHGQTEFNNLGKFHGITDIELNETGKKQARNASKLLESDYDVIISSPLKRARQTAEIVNENLNLEIIENPLIIERDFGNLEGLTWDEFVQKFPEEAAKNHFDYQPALDKGETIADVENRVDEFIKWLENSKYKKPLIVAHAGIIRVFERKLNNLTAEQSRKDDPANLELRKYNLHSQEWKQDEDVLDTWFSSGQWPYLTLMAREGDFEQFYPTQVMETGWDILLFWVTRMMLLNPYRMDKLKPDATDDQKVPFKDVYLHGLVLDKNGVKMSKSKGNGIDPFDMMQKYGTDALRFSFIKGNSVGQNYRLYEEKIASNRNFCNKIWNASKFVLMNIADDGSSLINMDKDQLALQVEDKNFLEHLQNLVSETKRRLDEYMFGIAADALYDSFWHEFADIYLETIKTRLYTKDRDGNLINTSPEEIAARQSAQWMILKALETYLKLLHPFIPFITEKIWQELPKPDGESETIMYSSWPSSEVK